jgi:DNA-binding transcriptional regulator YhcF (GntR family)
MVTMIPLARAETSQRVSTVQSQITSTERPLDRNGFVPLYFQIQRALLEKIHSGELREGDLLTSEWKLARAYHVSRVTAREALHGLKASGYASSLRGRGTFVTKPKLEKPQAEWLSHDTRERPRKRGSRQGSLTFTYFGPRISTLWSRARNQISATDCCG